MKIREITMAAKLPTTEKIRRTEKDFTASPRTPKKEQHLERCSGRRARSFEKFGI